MLETPESLTHHNVAGNGKRDGIKRGRIGRSAAKGLMHLLLTARLGDGSFQDTANGEKSSVKFMGTDELWIRTKAELLDLSYKVRVRAQHKNAWGKKDIFHVQTAFSTEIKKLRELSTLEVLEAFDEEDLVIWYLDDGSFHKRKRFMHLYCNQLNQVEAEQLIKKFEGLYGIAPKLRTDKKKDGRSFFYIYLGTELTKVFGSSVKAFIHKYSLDTLLYKVGEDQGSTTSRKT